MPSERIKAFGLIVMESLALVLPVLAVFELDALAEEGDPYGILFWRNDSNKKTRLTLTERGIVFFLFTVISLCLIYFVLNPLILGYTWPLYSPEASPSI
tara:strand:- start:160 stop:456 length:297 start_codon:yes stop_codon:yes gene_type:complete